MVTERDLQILESVARRLLYESSEEFSHAYDLWLDSQHATNSSRYMGLMRAAMTQKQLADRKREEALVLRRKCQKVRAVSIAESDTSFN